MDEVEERAIREGMPVYGSDGELVGPVVGLTGDPITPIIQIEGGYTVPVNAIAGVREGRVQLPGPATMYLSQLRAHWGAHEEAPTAHERGVAAAQPAARPAARTATRPASPSATPPASPLAMIRLGMAVRTSDGGDAGLVERVIVGDDTIVQAVVIRSGGLFTRAVPVPIEALTVEAGDTARLTYTADDLAAFPEFEAPLAVDESSPPEYAAPSAGAADAGSAPDPTVGVAVAPGFGLPVAASPAPTADLDREQWSEVGGSLARGQGVAIGADDAVLGADGESAGSVAGLSFALSDGRLAQLVVKPPDDGEPVAIPINLIARLGEGLVVLAVTADALTGWTWRDGPAAPGAGLGADV